MPVQQQMSSFAKRLGARVAEANAEHKDKPIDTGNRRLPAGIRDGIAKLSAMYTKEQTGDDGKTPKGETFFRASAIVVSPEEHDGEKVAGMVTSQTIPLCDVPARGMRKAKSFSENWYQFQNLFKLLGVAPCPETPQTDPTGQRTEAYFFAAMKMLTDPQRMREHPIYVSFSTRGFTPPLSPADVAAGRKSEEMVFEDWHGLADPVKISVPDPSAGVREGPPPTQSHGAPAPQAQTAPAQGAAPPPTNGPPPQYQPEEPDPADKVAYLVEVAMNDPEGATEEGAFASAQLEEMAWANGWTKEQTGNAADWAAVGDMALNPPPPAAQEAATIPADAPPQPAAPAVAVGTRWYFCKRTKDGEKLKNNKGEPFPSQEVEVTSIDAAAGTCTLKTVKDGKDVIDIRSKKPFVAKFEWLETAPY